MNLVLAIVFINLYVMSYQFDLGLFSQAGAQFFFNYMALINLLLMLFNLLPIGPLDGHYILPYFLSRDMAYKYVRWNAQYGAMALFGLIILSFLGLPIFSFLMNFAQKLASFLVIV